jgi:hypothetical protein
MDSSGEKKLGGQLHAPTEAEQATTQNGNGTHNNGGLQENVQFTKDTRDHDGSSSEETPPVSPTTPGGAAAQEKPADKMSKGRIALIMSALCVSVN